MPSLPESSGFPIKLRSFQSGRQRIAILAVLLIKDFPKGVEGVEVRLLCVFNRFRLSYSLSNQIPIFVVQHLKHLIMTLRFIPTLPIKALYILLGRVTSPNAINAIQTRFLKFRSFPNFRSFKPLRQDNQMRPIRMLARDFNFARTLTQQEMEIHRYVELYANCICNILTDFYIGSIGNCYSGFVQPG